MLAVVVPISVDEALGRFPKEKVSAKAARLGLSNAGVDLDTRGRIQRRTKSTATTLRVSIADLAPGDYALQLDGVPAGQLTVTKIDGSAKLRLSTTPKK